jgi:hypothetical protein
VSSALVFAEFMVRCDTATEMAVEPSIGTDDVFGAGNI